MGQSTRRTSRFVGAFRGLELCVPAETDLRLAASGQRDGLQTLALDDHRRKDTQLQVDAQYELFGVFALVWRRQRRPIVKFSDE